jgi:hypothetical protein
MVCYASAGPIVTGSLLLALEFCRCAGLVSFRPFNTRDDNQQEFKSSVVEMVQIIILYLARGGDSELAKDLVGLVLDILLLLLNSYWMLRISLDELDRALDLIATHLPEEKGSWEAIRRALLGLFAALMRLLTALMHLLAHFFTALMRFLGSSCAAGARVHLPSRRSSRTGEADDRAKPVEPASVVLHLPQPAAAAQQHLVEEDVVDDLAVDLLKCGKPNVHVGGDATMPSSADAQKPQVKPASHFQLPQGTSVWAARRVSSAGRGGHRGIGGSVRPSWPDGAGRGAGAGAQ